VSRHVSAEILALYREGAVSAAEAARIDAHLVGCARCSGMDAALTSLASMLAATQLPPMPEAFSIRIQMAITGESAARAAAGPASAAHAGGARASSGAWPLAGGVGERAAGAAGDGNGLGAAGAGGGTAETGSAHVPGRPDLPERRRGRWRRFRMPDWSSPLLLRGLAAAAAVVVIAGAGILLANARSASQSSGAGGMSSGQRVPAARPSVAGGTGRHVSSSANASGPIMVSYRMKGRIATAAAMVSQVNFTEGSLPGMVRKQVASVTGIGAGAGFATPTYQASPAPKFRIGGVSIPTLEGCLSAMANGRQVLLADVARFLGRPATIIVMKSPTTANVLDVAIVGLGCSSSSLDVIRMLTVPGR
jgi:Putative zinc-finger